MTTFFSLDFWRVVIYYRDMMNTKLERQHPAQAQAEADAKKLKLFHHQMQNLTLLSGAITSPEQGMARELAPPSTQEQVFATRIEVDRQCRELTHRIAGCVVMRSASLYYVRLDRSAGSPEILMEWRKLTRKRATEIGMDSRLFERTV